MDKDLKKLDKDLCKKHTLLVNDLCLSLTYFFRTTLDQLWQWPMCLCPTLETIHAKYVRNHHQDSNDDHVDVDDDNDDGGDGGNGDGNDNAKTFSTLKILAANITLREC